MAGKSPVVASAAQRRELMALSHSRDRGEADRARALLLTLAGWTSPRIAEAFGVREDTVRLWRSAFMTGGVDALRRSVAPGPAPVKAERALAVAEAVLAGASRGSPQLDLAAAGRRDREALRRAHLALAALGRVAPKGDFRWRRPRHTLKGRQDADAVDRAGLRRKLLKAQAEAGDIVLLFGDESEALTHPYLAHAWAKKGADLRIPAPGQAAKVAMLGLLDWAPRDLIVRTSRSKRSADFIALLEQIDTQYGPTPGRATKPIVLVLDNGPIHTSKATRAALAERAPWLTVEWLPKYAPELNDIEELWRDLKQHHLAHQTFAGPENLDDAIHEAVTMLNRERNRHPLANHRIAA